LRGIGKRTVGGGGKESQQPQRRRRKRLKKPKWTDKTGKEGPIQLFQLKKKKKRKREAPREKSSGRRERIIFTPNKKNFLVSTKVLTDQATFGASCRRAFLSKEKERKIPPSGLVAFLKGILYRADPCLSSNGKKGKYFHFSKGKRVIQRAKGMGKNSPCLFERKRDPQG